MTETTPTAARRAFLTRIKHSDLPDADKVTVLAIVRKAMSARKPKPKPLTPAQARWAAKTDVEKYIHLLKGQRGGLRSMVRGAEFSVAMDYLQGGGTFWTNDTLEYRTAWHEEQVKYLEDARAWLDECEDDLFAATNFIMWPQTPEEGQAMMKEQNLKCCRCGLPLIESGRVVIKRDALIRGCGVSCLQCVADREERQALRSQRTGPLKSTLRRERKAKRMLASVGVGGDLPQEETQP